MNRHLLATLTAAGLLFGSMSAAYASCSGDDRNRWMTVYNKSSSRVTSIIIKPTQRDAPASRNLLGTSTIPARDDRRVEFDYCSGECVFDIAVKGSLRIWYRPRINVCRESRLDLYN